MIASEGSGLAQESATVRQLHGDAKLMSRLESPWQRIVVLERVARGAGATRWYLVKDRRALERTFASLGPGSQVTLYFQGPMCVGPLDPSIIGEMFATVGDTGEIVIAHPKDGAVALQVEFVSGPSELTEFLMQPNPSGDLVWGPFPGQEEPDALTIDLVDADRVLRPHPH